MDSDGCINHCNERNEKVKKNWRHLFSCNDRNKCNKGVLMIKPHLSVQHYVTRVTIVSGRCVNHCNERNEKVPKKLGTSFPM